MSADETNPYASGAAAAGPDSNRPGAALEALADAQRYGKRSRLLHVLVLPVTIVAVVASVVIGDSSEEVEGEAVLMGLLVLGGFGVGLLVWVAGTVYYFVWMIKSGRTLRDAGVELTFGPVWIVFGYIIPIASLWIPYAYTQEVYRATAALAQGRLDRWREAPAATSIVFWWILFVVLVPIGNLLPEGGQDELWLAYFAAFLLLYGLFIYTHTVILRAQGEAIRRAELLERETTIGFSGDVDRSERWS